MKTEQTDGYKTLIVAGGRMERDFALSFLCNGAQKEECTGISGEIFGHSSYDYMIAVDGGLRMLHELNLTPTDIVGDFDTVEPDLLSRYADGGKVRIHRYNPQKDNADSEIAVELAVKYGSSQIDILGGTGGRLDHTIGNLRLLGLIYRAAHGACRAFLYDSNNRVRLVDGECVIKKGEAYGKYISVLPYTQLAEGITLEGFHYPLRNHTMELFQTPTLGISNEITGQQGRILVKKGVLLVIESKD